MDSKEKERPGIKPKVPDHLLTTAELKKREKRRARNKAAAVRCREKKSNEISALFGIHRF